MLKSKSRIAAAGTAVAVATSATAVLLLGGGSATAAEPRTTTAVAPANTVTGTSVVDGSLYQKDFNQNVINKVFRVPGFQSVTAWSIRPGTITEDKLDPALKAKVNAPGTGEQGPKGEPGAPGPKGEPGAPGDSYLTGAYYSVAYYDNGNVNAGAISTVACKLETDTAISGGVSIDDYTKNTPVSQSFPGRMDWATNTPKPNRLDGWVIQFGGNAGAVSDKDPLKVKVWALCVPGLTLPVVETYTQSQDN
jgi:hypothetical protein